MYYVYVCVLQPDGSCLFQHLLGSHNRNGTLQFWVSYKRGDFANALFPLQHDHSVSWFTRSHHVDGKIQLGDEGDPDCVFLTVVRSLLTD